jgi:hypothetical protein
MGGFTVLRILWLAAAVIAVFLAVLWVVMRAGVAATGAQRGRHPKILRTLVLGTDNRTSTSKTMVLLWTLLVVWALLALLIAGELLELRPCAATGTLAEQIAACRAAPSGGRVALMQVSWHQLVEGGLNGGYLILLGVPGIAALTAKGVTQTKDLNGTAPKTNAPDPVGPGKTMARLAQLFSRDDGATDLGDTQYVLFNLVLAGYFVIRMAKPDGTGLPPLPDALLGLTGVAAALYVGKKAVDRTTPVISTVFPTTLAAGQSFTVVGSSLTGDLAADGALPPGQHAPAIKIDGEVADDVTVDPKTPDRIVARAPSLPPGPHTLTVVNAWGVETPDGKAVLMR